MRPDLYFLIGGVIAVGVTITIGLEKPSLRHFIEYWAFKFLFSSAILLCGMFVARTNKMGLPRWRVMLQCQFLLQTLCETYFLREPQGRSLCRLAQPS